MMVLIIGGSGSGKSAYAEEYIGRLSGKSNKYYLATMQVFDEEGKKKVSRHQRLRKNKGFLTIEQPIDIEKTLPKIKAGSSVLLECISNLTANDEFFGVKILRNKQEVIRKLRFCGRRNPEPETKDRTSGNRNQ